MNAAFFNAVRKTVFGGSLTQDQVDGINVITRAWSELGDGDDHKLAYLLATTKHETADTMQPIHERGPMLYFDKYEPGTKIGQRLGNTQKGDGYRFRGRGYVQLTGRANYEKASGKLALPLLLSKPPQAFLIGNPDKALDPEIAAKILIKGCMEGWFTARKLAGHFDGSHAAYVDARRVINGTDRGELIAGYAEKFAKALALAKEQPEPAPTPVQPDVEPPEQIPVEDAYQPSPTDRHRWPWWAKLILAIAIIGVASAAFLFGH